MKQLLNTLYILTPDTYLFLENEAIGVKIGGEVKVRVPAHTISSVYCFGNVTVSTPLIGFCGERNQSDISIRIWEILWQNPRAGSGEYSAQTQTVCCIG